jgi:hypothetical protein
MTNARTPTQFTAADGTECLHVPLAGNRGDAIIEGDALPLLAQVGVTLSWSFNRNGRGRRYVRGNLARGNTISIARIVAGARRGQLVCYCDGNPLNLRRSNLYVVEGRAKTDCAAMLAYCAHEGAKVSPKISERASTDDRGRGSPHGYRLAKRANAGANLGACK